MTKITLVAFAIGVLTSGCVAVYDNPHPARNFMNGLNYTLSSPEQRRRLKEEERQQRLQEQQQGYQSAYPQ